MARALFDAGGHAIVPTKRARNLRGGGNPHDLRKPLVTRCCAQRVVPINHGLMHVFVNIVDLAGRQIVAKMASKRLTFEVPSTSIDDLLTVGRVWPAPIWWPGSNLMHGRLGGHG
jgi:hypothetical protein